MIAGPFQTPGRLGRGAQGKARRAPAGNCVKRLRPIFYHRGGRALGAPGCGALGEAGPTEPTGPPGPRAGGGLFGWPVGLGSWPHCMASGRHPALTGGWRGGTTPPRQWDGKKPPRQRGPGQSDTYFEASSLSGPSPVGRASASMGANVRPSSGISTKTDFWGGPARGRGQPPPGHVPAIQREPKYAVLEKREMPGGRRHHGTREQGGEKKEEHGTLLFACGWNGHRAPPLGLTAPSRRRPTRKAFVVGAPTPPRTTVTARPEARAPYSREPLGGPMSPQVQAFRPHRQ